MKVKVAATGIQNNPNDIHVFAADPLFFENKSTSPTGAYSIEKNAIPLNVPEREPKPLEIPRNKPIIIKK